MEVEVDTTPLWSAREESSLDSEGKLYVLPKAYHRYPAYAPLSFSASPLVGTWPTGHSGPTGTLGFFPWYRVLPPTAPTLKYGRATVPFHLA